jgi:hypothetical protein
MSTDTIGGPGGRGAEKSREIQLGRATLRCLFGRLIFEFPTDAIVAMPTPRSLGRCEMRHLDDAGAHL